MNKYEQLVEFIINDENDKARELFHQIVVEKSRDIYESLVAEEDLDETMGGNEVEELVDEVTLDEQGMTEEEEDDMDMSMDDEDHHADVGGEEELEDRVMDLEDALDELKAEFDQLMAGDDGDAEQVDQFGAEDEFGAEEEQQFMEAEEDDAEEDEEELDETIVREYVEKVADTGQKNPNGAMSASGNKTPKQGETNTKSIVAGANNMGGSAVTSKGGNQNQDGNRPAATEKPKGTLVSNPQNKPGANAGKTAFKTKEASTGSEGKLAGNDGSVAVNKQSPLRKA